MKDESDGFPNPELLLIQAGELGVLSKNTVSPFPYQDVRQLLKTFDELEHLIPDLDLYFAEIWGYASWGKTILDWSLEKIEAVKEAIQARISSSS